MATSILISILGFGLLSLAIPSAQLDVRQAASFSPQAACTTRGGKFSKGYTCLNSLGAATASAYCSSRFSTTSTATTPTYTITDITVTSTTFISRTGTPSSTVTIYNSTVTNTVNATSTSFTCPSSTTAASSSISPTGPTSVPTAGTTSSSFSSLASPSSTGATTASVPTKLKRQAASPITTPTCFGASVSPTARAVCSACFGVTAGTTTVYPSTNTYASTTTVTLTRIITPTATVTAVATANSTRTATVTTAYPLPTSNFILLYPSGEVTLYGRARNLSSGVAIGLAQYSSDNFHFVSGEIRDVDQSDDIVTEPPPGVLDLLFLVNTTSSTQSTPVCYVCGDTQTVGCDFPDASGNVTNPGQDVWANCGGYLSLGRDVDFANPPLGVQCSVIRRLYYSLTAGSGTS
ncbi:hypothetical protein LTR91_016420 [Friedmanniomyces endolithicus]|uniref:Uncharacterized protein n=1 Tax=Friedmanniomyces endolithicus TaxID=329885 RepID=A0AAN6K8H3_9PEZI|nr:hypothetical protein LTR94_009733 [Friedmanniomyces endolithicus]KAK0781729.1 hypothetical protein LTR38_013663 [Friedmanniomyces endolithicus]KAK0784057.1 hypothetical protein LTR75_013924 [Friedmanniomyces endolithicus]KAK0816007.1 hypothetical protein LTR59_000380 [Friedmanniomyces endolithicus]KAK0832640.1 hypothetical protein LTR03_015028 [Friedmanniomyces endolithicus]